MIIPNMLINIIIPYFLVLGLRQNDIEDACQEVRNRDEYLCELIQSPKPYNRDKVFSGIKAYIRSFNQLSTCLASSTNLTLEVCQDVFHEQGANFMHIRFDRDDLINGFQLDEEGMDKYEMLRGQTLDAWLKCEKFIYKHSSFEIF